MQAITGLTSQQIGDLEVEIELAVRLALQRVMDQVADRIARIQTASAVSRETSRHLVLVAADQTLPPSDPGIPWESPSPPPEPLPPVPDAPPPDGLPPGQPYVSLDDLATIPTAWGEQIALNVLPIVAQTWMGAGNTVHAGLAQATGVAVPKVGNIAAEQYLAQARNTFDQIGTDLWGHARESLLDGFARGDSIPQLAQGLRDTAGVTARQGTLVARTQITEASNAGSYAVAKASGLAMQKEWMSAMDVRTRTTHAEADGQRVGLDDYFVVGNHQALYPADPGLPPSERYNCRCTLGYVMLDHQVRQAQEDAIPQPPLPGQEPIVSPVDQLANDLTAQVEGVAAELHGKVEQTFADVHAGIEELGIPPVPPPRWEIADLTGARGLSSVPEVRAVQIENRIRRAYAVAPKNGAGWVALADLRDGLGESISRREVDEALVRMSRERGMSLLPEENQKVFSLTERGPAIKEAAVRMGPQDYHYLDIENHQLELKPLPGKPLPAQGLGVPKPGAALPTGAGDPMIPRPALAHAHTPKGLETAWRSELKRITGRDVAIQVPDGASLATWRSWAEGTLRGAEAFPEARITEIIALDQGEAGVYATSQGTSIRFNTWWGAEEQRAPYLRAIRGDQAGWSSPDAVGWFARGETMPAGTAIHEYGHVVDLGSLGGRVHPAVVKLVEDRAAAEGISADALIRRDISAYASSDDHELIAEAFADVMTRGDAAAPISKEIVGVLRAEYDRTFGLGLPEVFTPEELALPAVSPAGALSSKTIPQLRALAKERGIEVPPAIKRPDLVKLLEGSPAAEARTSLAGQAAHDAALPRTPLAADVEDAVDTYGKGGASVVNKMLRDSGGVIDTRQGEFAADVARKLDQAMAEQSLPETIVVHRGVHGDAAKVMFGRGEIRVGKTFTEPAFVSTSVRDTVGYADAGAVHLHITVPKGTRALSMPDALEGAPRGALDRGEVLLDRGMTFRVTAVREGAAGVRDVDVEVVSRVAPVKAVKVAAPKAVKPLTPAKLKADLTAKGVTVPEGLREPALRQMAAEIERGVAPAQARATAVQTILDERKTVAQTLSDLHQQILTPGTVPSERLLKYWAGKVDALPKELRAGPLAEALRAGDLAKVKTQAATLARSAKITPVKAGAKLVAPGEAVPFDRATMELAGSAADIPDGTYVHVLQPGYTTALEDRGGVLVRAQVQAREGLGPQVKPVKVAPARKATTQSATDFDRAAQKAISGRKVRSAIRVDQDSAAISQEARDSIMSYGGVGYHDIGPFLRTGEVSSSPAIRREVQREIAGLDEAMQASPLDSDVLLWRGLRTGDEVFGAGLKRDLTGFSWTEDSYLSTSYDRTVAESFATISQSKPGVLIRMVAPDGTGAVALTYGTGEPEVLLQRGLRLRVVKDHGITQITAKGRAAHDVRVLDVEVVPANPVKATPVKKVAAKKAATAKATPRATPAKAPAPKATPPAKMTPARIRQMMDETPIEVSDLAGGAMAESVKLRTYATGEQIVVKTTREAGGRGVRQADAEELGALITDAVGGGARSATVVRVGPRTVAMQYIDGPIGAKLSVAEQQAAIAGEAGKRTGLADYLMSNSDRNNGGWFRLANGDIVSVDNSTAWSFGFSRRFAEYLIDPGGRQLREHIDLSVSDLVQIRRKIRALQSRFVELGHEDWFNETMDRLAEVRKRAIVGNPAVKAIKPATEARQFVDRANSVPDLAKNHLDLSGVPDRVLTPWVEKARTASDRELVGDVARLATQMTDVRRATADLFAEVQELVATGADKDVLAFRAQARMKRIADEIKDWPEEAAARQLLAAIESGDPAAIKRAVTAGERRLKLQRVGEAGKTAPFDTATMAPVTPGISREAVVEVIRPGYAVDMGNGRIVLSKASVDVEVVPKGGPVAHAAASSSSAYNSKTLAELRRIAKERGVVVPPGARKPEIVKALAAKPSAEGAAPVQVVSRAAAKKAAKAIRPEISAPHVDPHGTAEQIAAQERAVSAHALDQAPIRLQDLARGRKPGAATLKYYQQRGDVEMNGLLRRGAPGRTLGAPLAQPAAVQQRVDEMDALMAASPISEDITVYRGIQSIGRVFPGDTGEVGSLVGRSFTDRGFTSTTASRRVADQFAGSGPVGSHGMTVEVRVPKGTRAVQISNPDYAGHVKQGWGSEQEILLDRDLKYRVVSDELVPDYAIYASGRVELTGQMTRRVVLEVVPSSAPRAAVVAKAATKPAVKATPRAKKPPAKKAHKKSWLPAG